MTWNIEIKTSSIGLERSFNTKWSILLVIHQNDSDIVFRFFFVQMHFEWPRIGIQKLAAQLQQMSDRFSLTWINERTTDRPTKRNGMSLNSNFNWIRNNARHLAMYVEICSRRLAFYAAGKMAFMSIQCRNNALLRCGQSLCFFSLSLGWLRFVLLLF